VTYPGDNLIPVAASFVRLPACPGTVKQLRDYERLDFRIFFSDISSPKAKNGISLQRKNIFRLPTSNDCNPFAWGTGSD
jgi:hypothetical protein